jgi:hypothetical protein
VSYADFVLLIVNLAYQQNAFAEGPEAAKLKQFCGSLKLGVVLTIKTRKVLDEQGNVYKEAIAHRRTLLKSSEQIKKLF